MTRRKKKLAAKYLVRRVVFALLAAALLALAHSLLLERVYAPYIRGQLGEEEPEEDDG